MPETGTSAPDARGSPYLPALDGWRAVSISLVMAHHLGWGGFLLGRLGVLCFFSISGLLITGRLMHEWRSTGRVSFKAFYVRRAFRILPPALMYLGVVSLLAAFGWTSVTRAGVLGGLFFVRNYVVTENWNTAHFWSLSVEEQFYIVWPALLVLVGLRRGRWLTPLLAVGATAWRYWDSRSHFLYHLLQLPSLADNVNRSDYVAESILWGCSFALWLDGRQLRNRAWVGWGCVGLMVMLAVQVAHPEARHGAFLLSLIPAILVAMTSHMPGGWLTRILEFPPLRWIGRLSYSLYLWQQLFLSDGSPARRVGSVLIVFACAAGSYYLVERPSIRRARHLLKSGASEMDIKTA